MSFYKRVKERWSWVAYLLLVWTILADIVLVIYGIRYAIKPWGASHQQEDKKNDL